MMPVVQSRTMSHVALKVEDVEQQIAFYTNLVGFGLTSRDSRGNAFLRCNGDHHALVLMPSASSGIDHYAISVGGTAELDRAEDALTRAGIPHENLHGGNGTGLGRTTPRSRRLRD